MRAGPARLGENPPLLTRDLGKPGWFFSGLGAGLTLFTTSTLSVCWCIHSILKQDGVENEADVTSRRLQVYKDTLAITKYIIFSL